MSEKIFQKKFEILEYLGKDRRDTKLIDRMITRGEVIKTEEWYQLVQKEDPSEYLKKIKELENKILELEEEIAILKSEPQNPIPNKKPDMDMLRNIVAGRFPVEPKEEKKQFEKAGDCREWNWNTMKYTWRIVTKKKIYKYGHENRLWYRVEDLCWYDKWVLVKLDDNDGVVYEDSIIDIDADELKFYFEN